MGFKSHPFSLVLVLPFSLFLISPSSSSLSHAFPHLHHPQNHSVSEIVEEREWNTRRVAAETSGNSTYLILAANRTRRRDPSDGFHYYTGGWNFTNPHYLYSVGFSAAPPLLLALVWFLVFGLCLCCVCLRRCCCCCPRKEPYGYSRAAYAISLAFLVLLALTAVTGIAMLYSGQLELQGSIAEVTGYVLHQADTVIVNLKNLLNNLLAAKNIGVGDFTLPLELQTNIDNISTTINGVADDFQMITTKNSEDIWRYLEPVRRVLIYVATFLAIFSLLGFLLSILGVQSLVYSLIAVGWVLVVAMLVLSGLLLLIHNVLTDTCVAVDEWLLHPGANSALEEIFPKVDYRTAQDILHVTRGITYGLVELANGALDGISNADFPPNAKLLYYNQSGPLVPRLCNPYNLNLTDRRCAAGEVDFNNASEVWRSYTCLASASGICATRGRLTPDRYTQMTATLNMSYGLYAEGPFLVDLIDSTFVKETFGGIGRNYCPGLIRHSKWAYAGLAMTSLAILLSLIVWMAYARQRRHRSYTKKIDRFSNRIMY